MEGGANLPIPLYYRSLISLPVQFLKVARKSISGTILACSGFCWQKSCQQRLITKFRYVKRAYTSVYYAHIIPVSTLLSTFSLGKMPLAMVSSRIFIQWSHNTCVCVHVCVYTQLIIYYCVCIHNLSCLDVVQEQNVVHFVIYVLLPELEQNARLCGSWVFLYHKPPYSSWGLILKAIIFYI